MSRALVEVGFAFGMHFARAARDGLGWIDLVEGSTHRKDLLDELSNEFLPGVSQFMYRTVVGFPVD